jgi:hypothetical protein
VQHIHDYYQFILLQSLHCRKRILGIDAARYVVHNKTEELRPNTGLYKSGKLLRIHVLLNLKNLQRTSFNVLFEVEFTEEIHV